MKLATKRSIILLAQAALAVFAWDLSQRNDGPFKAGPKIMLWAWQRPENLDYIDTSKVGVAVLGGTISLSGNRVMLAQRVQPLAVPKDAYVMAVVRIQSDPCAPPVLSKVQVKETVKQILRAASMPCVRCVQIDFDARKTERPFYSAVLSGVRAALPGDVPLSMTALASWCDYDTWLNALPVDEVVPMLFRMGRGGDRVLADLRQGRKLTTDSGRLSVGLATDEPAAFMALRDSSKRASFARVFLFSPCKWERGSTLVQEVEQWL